MSKSARDGVNALNGNCHDYGLLTTPQLHYIVACYNAGEKHVNEETYYKKFSAAFKDLVNSVSMVLCKFKCYVVFVYNFSN